MITGSARLSVMRSSSKIACGIVKTQRSPSFSRPTFLPTTNITSSVRSSSVFENFTPKPPESLTVEIAEGICVSTQFYCRHGVSSQQLRHIASLKDLSIVERWQQMMEVYVTTQIHVVAGIGYESSPEGLNVYALHLAQVISKMDDSTKDMFSEIRRSTWRDVVGTVFQIEPRDIRVVPIEEARELMHKVSKRMTDPDILHIIQNRTYDIKNSNEDVELQLKHMELQKILVNEVYLGGDPSFVEETGFGTGPTGYAKIQCALTDYEGDPILANYASSSMLKILSAAGIDVDKIDDGPGLSTNPV